MPSISRWVLSTFASPLGVVILAALDSTIFFSLPFGIDAVVAIVAAHGHTLAWFVPLLATAGSIAGAAVSFVMGVKIGDHGLERYVPPKRLQRIRARIRNSGAIALAVLDLIPPPFPFTPFVLAAGALDVKPWTFFVTLAVCRLLRFGLVAALGARYGPSILRLLESDLVHDVVTILIVVTVALTGWSLFTLVRATRTSGRRSVRRARA